MTRKSKKKKTSSPAVSDPFAEREAEIYTNPIPSREFILQLMGDTGVPLTQNAISDHLGIEPDQEEALRRRLRAMVRDGQLIRQRKGQFILPTPAQTFEGIVTGHRDGFGFLVPDDGSDDIFLGAHVMRQLFHGDKAEVRITNIDHRGRLEGTLVKVLERNTYYVTGRFLLEHGVGFVQSANPRVSQDIVIPNDATLGAQHGQFVTAEITAQPSERNQPIGRITEVIGNHMAPGMEIDIAIRTHNIPHIFPDDVLRQAEKTDLILDEETLKDRTDLRQLPFVTIDGEDAKDFDDAIYCEPSKTGGFRLFVAIADVTHYMQTDTPLDIEAKNRGTSVYFPGQVIPMLPEKLSNYLCSLVPHEDRLAMVCEMSLSAKGKLTRYKFYPAVFQSKARLTYTQVGDYLENHNKQAVDKSLHDAIDAAYALYLICDKNRKVRGAIEFDTTETQILFGENRKIEKIVPVTRNVAHKLIEECMLLANVSAAQFITKNKANCLFRVHREPDAAKLGDLQKTLNEMAIKTSMSDEPTPKEFADLLTRIKDREDAHLLQTLILRSLNQAVYSPDNEGHFGLAYPEYTHFTSPIRRYPDVIVHRTIRALLKNLEAPLSHKALTNLGEHCSTTERRADEATRDAVSWLKCEYMMDRVGETFDGIITSVTGFGMFVELSNIFVEGLVHITRIHDDYYTFDPLRHRLTGERTGKKFSIGDPVKVLLAKVDLDSQQIDFDLVLPEGQPKPVKKSVHRNAPPKKYPKNKKSRRKK